MELLWVGLFLLINFIALRAVQALHNNHTFQRRIDRQREEQAEIAADAQSLLRSELLLLEQEIGGIPPDQVQQRLIEAEHSVSLLGRAWPMRDAWQVARIRVIYLRGLSYTQN